MEFVGAMELYFISHPDYVISAAVGCLLVPVVIYFGSRDTIVSDKARSFFTEEDESSESLKQKQGDDKE
jgi:hypothetical protein